MLKRFFIVAIVVAAILVLAAPALAFDGFRDDVHATARSARSATPARPARSASTAAGQRPSTPSSAWTTPARPWPPTPSPSDAARAAPAAIPATTAQRRRRPSRRCSRRRPRLRTCTRTRTRPATTPSLSRSSAAPRATTALPCGGGTDPADTAHAVPYANMASAEICGQCHSRYSKSVSSYPIQPAPTARPPSSRVHAGRLQPARHRRHDACLDGRRSSARSSRCRRRTAPASQVYYKDARATRCRTSPRRTTAARRSTRIGRSTESDHEPRELLADPQGRVRQRAVPQQLPRVPLRRLSHRRRVEQGARPRVRRSRLQAAPDDQTMPSTASPARRATPRTTQVRLRPRVSGTRSSTPQLKAPAKQLCVRVPQRRARREPDAWRRGARGRLSIIPMKEMMNGTGAIDVPQGSPSVHKGKCVQCHMPPTGYGREGAGTAANHVFEIIEPDDAKEARATVSSAAGAPAAPMPMPYSACTTCHSRPGDDQAVVGAGHTDRPPGRHEGLGRPDDGPPRGRRRQARVQGQCGDSRPLRR